MSLSSARRRQAACPCQSGRRLASCCLPWEEAFQRLASRLLTFAATPRIRQHEADAAAVFWDIQGAVRPGKGLGPEGGLRFLEWFLHDYSPGRGATLLGAFADGAVGLDPREDHLLLASLRAPVRAHEVTEASGARLVVTDPLAGGQYALEPLALPDRPIRSDLLICRLLFLGRVSRPGASILVLPGTCREELLAYLRTTYRVARPPRHVSLEDFLDGSAHLYHHFFLSRGRNLGGRAVETVRRVAFAPGRVLYRGEDASRIRAALERQSELERDEAGGEEGRYAYIDPERAVSRATVVARPGQVELRADSREDLAAARTVLETCLRGLIQPVAEPAGGPDDSFGDEVRRHGSSLPGAAFFARLLDTWPDTPSPLLEGRTPREAMRSRGGRERIAAFLRDLERDLGRLKRLGRASADLASVREGLDLTPDPPRTGRTSG